MNTKRIILAACCLLLTTLAARAADVFRMKKAAGAHVETLKVERRFGKSEAFSPFLSKGAITALSITGSFEKTGDEYLVRVLLKDADGKEHLVMESYEEICDKEQFAFAGYCEETALLEGIRPDSIKVYVRDAVLRIESIDIQTVAPGRMLKGGAFKAAKAEARRAQVEAVAKKINEYNVSHGKLWRAGVTETALLDYEERLRMIGCSNFICSGGLEYYTEGLFDMEKSIHKNSIQKRLATTQMSPYINIFDWRNRHGINWLTEEKSQGGSSCCVAFAGVGCLEALVNLYYNRDIDLDLSERELACKGGAHEDPYNEGVSPNQALYQLIHNGIGFESFYPFEGLRDYKCNEDSLSMNHPVVGIYEYEEIEENVDSIKKALIKYGPLSSGYVWPNYLPIDYDSTLNVEGHAMVLIGYHTIQAGDTFTVGNDTYVFEDNSPAINRTYWIFKNSTSDIHSQFMYISFGNNLQMAKVFAMKKPYFKNENGSVVTPYSVQCIDRDGDGFYYWGVGPKPSNAPSGIPNIPDGDDSNYSLGPMDEYGHLQSLNVNNNPIISINGPVTYSDERFLFGHVNIVNGGRLTVNDDVHFYGSVKMTISGNGTLIIDGATLYDAEIILQDNASIVIKNGGKIILRANKDFDVPIGTTLNIEQGEIY